MSKFLELEGGYLVIALIILLVTLFVTTRPFMSKGSIKKGLTGVVISLAIMIGIHYKVTIDRMREVKEAFSKGEVIICESRMQRKVAQSIDISKANEWSLDGDVFTSPNYSRPFHTARCLVK